MIQLDGFVLSFTAFQLGPLSLEIPAQSYTWLAGPSGAGKSLLLEAIAGLWSPASGSLKLRGEDAKSLSPDKRGIGWVPQAPTLFPHMSVFENIAFGLRARSQNTATLHDRVSSVARSLALSELCERKTGSLSGGEKQRVNLARALAINPDILLLDEPFANLNEALRRELQEIVLEHHKTSGLTVVHVTHHEPPPVVTQQIELLQGQLV